MLAPRSVGQLDQSRFRSPLAVRFWKVTTIFSPALPGGGRAPIWRPNSLRSYYR